MLNALWKGIALVGVIAVGCLVVVQAQHVLNQQKPDPGSGDFVSLDGQSPETDGQASDPAADGAAAVDVPPAQSEPTLAGLDVAEPVGHSFDSAAPPHPAAASEAAPGDAQLVPITQRQESEESPAEPEPNPFAFLVDSPPPQEEPADAMQPPAQDEPVEPNPFAAIARPVPQQSEPEPEPESPGRARYNPFAVDEAPAAPEQPAEAVAAQRAAPQQPGRVFMEDAAEAPTGASADPQVARSEAPLNPLPPEHPGPVLMTPPSGNRPQTSSGPSGLMTALAETESDAPPGQQIEPAAADDSDSSDADDPPVFIPFAPSQPAAAADDAAAPAESDVTVPDAVPPNPFAVAEPAAGNADEPAKMPLTPPADPGTPQVSDNPFAFPADPPESKSEAEPDPAEASPFAGTSIPLPEPGPEGPAGEMQARPLDRSVPTPAMSIPETSDEDAPSESDSAPGQGTNETPPAGGPFGDPVPVNNPFAASPAGGSAPAAMESGAPETAESEAAVPDAAESEPAESEPAAPTPAEPAGESEPLPRLDFGAEPSPRLSIPADTMPTADSSIPADAAPADSELPGGTPPEPGPAMESEDTPPPLPTLSLEPEPAPTEPAPTEPAPAEPATTEPAASGPAASGPAASGPAESEPAESEPAESEPAESEPAESEPAESEPAESEPTPTEPAPTEPAPMEPAPMEPAPVAPTLNEPAPAESVPQRPAPAMPVQPSPTLPSSIPLNRQPIEASPSSSQPDITELIGDGVPDQNAPAGPQQPELKIEKIAPPQAVLGEPVIYEILIRNVGNSPAQDVIVEDRIPRGATLTGTKPRAELIDRRLTWRLGTMEPGQERSIKIRVIPTEPGEIGSVATVRFVAAVTARTVITSPKIDIDIQGPQELVVGEPGTFRFRVSNTGSADADNVYIRNILPIGLSHAGGRDLEYEVGKLPAGKTREVELTVSAVQTGEFQNRAMGIIGTSSKCEASVPVRIIESRLSISRTGPARRFVGRPATYETVITNHSSQPLRNVTVEEELPTGVEPAGLPEGGRYDPAKRRNTWMIAELAPGQSQTLVSKLLATQAGNLQTVVKASDAAGNRAEAASLLEAAGVSSLSVDVLDTSHDGRPIPVGEQVSYRLKVRNRGSADASKVQVVFELPDELEFVTASGPVDFEQEGQTVRFSVVERLGIDQEREFDVVLSAAREGTARVKAKLSSAEQGLIIQEQPVRIY